VSEMLNFFLSSYTLSPLLSCFHFTFPPSALFVLVTDASHYVTPPRSATSAESSLIILHAAPAELNT